MSQLTKEGAVALIKAFTRPVDQGIYPALINFMVVADRLGADTTESCHGHANWVLPYPNIRFAMKVPHRARVPIWKLRNWHNERMDSKDIVTAYKQRTVDAISFLIREIVAFHKKEQTAPEHMFTVVRVGWCRFMIVTAYPSISDGLRASGSFDELEALMVGQRATLTRLSSALLGKVESLASLSVEDRCDCSACCAKH